MTARDPRLTPARPDLAAEHLRGEVRAPRYAAGVARRVTAPSAPLRRRPAPDAPLDTEALMGEPVTVYDDRDGFSWVQLGTDGYVGYLPSSAVGECASPPTHRVRALRTFVYPGPDLKLPPTSFLSLGAALLASGPVENGYLPLAAGGFAWADHLGPARGREADHAAVAERFVGTPYLWGGRTSLGLDCSALVQLALAEAGQAAPRDSDQQERSVGEPLDPADRAGLRRGDLVFWRGHVGIMLDGERLLHANGHHMAVAAEPLAGAERRILANSHGPVTAIRRPVPATGRRG